MSSTTENKRLLQQGIQALRAGHRTQAYALFVQVIEQDETNEQAWLWLSGAVTSDEERLICLENVLTINPANEAARKGLAQLQKTAVSTNPEQAASPASLSLTSETAVRRLTQDDFTRQGKSSISPVTDILYPDRPTVEWRYHDPTPLRQPLQTEFISESTFDDIWTTDEILCAYCATPLEEEVNTCPNCRRTLTTFHYRYPQPSSSLHILWVLLAGAGMQSLIRVGYEQIVVGNSARAGLQLLLMTLFFGAAFVVFMRHPWAQLGAILLTVLVTILNIITALLPPNLERLGIASMDESIVNFVGPLLAGIGQVLFVLQIITLLMTLYFAIFAVAPDFDKVKVRNVATLAKGLRSANQYHRAARKFADRKMWASAVLNWQRAAAHQPNNFAYLRHLGQAYAQLGFYERSLDVLQSARQFANTGTKQSELGRLLGIVQQAQQKGEPASTSHMANQPAGSQPEY